MWKKQLIWILCILYMRNSLAKAFRSTKIDYGLQGESRRHSSYRGKSVTTTPRPLLQQYWNSFVRHLPTLPPISWNITNPIGNIFNSDKQHFIQTPVTMHYTIEESNRPKTTKRKPNKHKTTKKSKTRKGLQSRNYYNSYDNSYQKTQLQLQSLGLDHNGVMHFYEPSSGQYYALQVESQPYYYRNPYENQYNDQYFYQPNQYNGYNRYDDEDDGDSSIESESFYTDNGYYPEYGYNYYPENGHKHGKYDPEHRDYDNEYEENDENNMDYDDGVELVDNWGYNDEEIFADRKLKGGSNNFDKLAERIIKIQKHLLKPETEEDAKLLLSKGQKVIDNTQDTNKKETEVESVRNFLSTFMEDDAFNRNKQTTNAQKTMRLVEKPRKKSEYYLFPSNFWL